MSIVAIVSEKGGVGKTTLALGLAVVASKDGKKAAVIDTDPQATAAKWTDRRENEWPWVVTSPSARLRQAVELSTKQGVDFLVIDTPPHSGIDAIEAARLADIVIVPVEPHAFAIDTVEKTRDALKLAGNTHAFALITKAPIQGKDAHTATEHIKSLGLPVCQHILYLRAAHRHASNIGQGAIEFEPSGKAALEIKKVYEYTCKLLCESGKKNGKEKPATKRA